MYICALIILIYLFYYFINIQLSKYIMIERFKLGHNVDRNRQDRTRLDRALAYNSNKM